jgi:PKHD-type hydroxylase
MSIVLEAVLAAEDVARVQAGLAAAPWTDGRKTAGAAAQQVKANQQAQADDPGVAALERFVLEALRRHPLFEIAARPASVSRVMFSRYAPGMEYGAHTDDALMGPPDARLRTDLAFTIFLAAREAYAGGELVIESALGEQAVKLAAGDAMLYPAGSIHRVAPVESGERLAAVGWVQSLVADAAQREILFDLSVARTRLAGAGVAREDLLGIDKAISNLLRQWARP